MRLHHLADDGEAEARAVRAAIAVELVEALEDARKLLRRNVRSGVMHSDADVVAFALGADRDHAARRRVADGVVDQVGERLFQSPLVAGHGRDRGEVEPQRGAGVA